jgi:ribosomal protein S4
MQIGPKYKICRRLGTSVFEKCQTQKYALSESRRRDDNRNRRQSKYGEQLLEKQQVRYTYGIAEKQFSRWVNKAMDSHELSPVGSKHGLIMSYINSGLPEAGRWRGSLSHTVI